MEKFLKFQKLHIMKERILSAHVVSVTLKSSERYIYNWAVRNRWTGPLEWTTGMDFNLFLLLPPAKELAIYIEELV